MQRAALIVGVDRYDDPEIQHLSFAEADAMEVHGFLRHAAGFDRVEFLKGPQVDSAAVLDTASDVARTLEPGDLFVFYFAGHGVEHEGKHLLLCPKARYRRLRHGVGVIPVGALRDEMDAPGLDRVLILDACRSDLLRARDAGPQGMHGEQVLRDVVVRAQSEMASAGSGALAVLCSCAENQQAGEIAGEKHGLFTASLLGVLQEGLRAGDTVALSDALEVSLAARMAELARRHGLPPGQRPWIQRSGPAPILIPGGYAVPHPTEMPEPPRPAPPKRPSEVRIIEPPKLRVTTVPSGAEVTIDGRSAGRSPVSVELSTGRHRVVVRLEGYRDWDKQIHFQGDADAALPIELQAGSRLMEAFFPMTAEEARDVQCAAAEALGLPLTDELDCGGGVKLRLILIPPGTFLMGSPAGEEDRGSDEGPQHEVMLTQPFYMGVHQVTQAQYKAVTGKKPSGFTGDANPVENVSWKDAGRFCAALTERTGKIVSLPTEAQWEYACRAGSASRFSFGDEDAALPLHAWFDGNSGGKTHPVGQKKPNAWGLYDMHGNVWEWCQDWYGKPYYAGSPKTDPKGPTSGGRRVLRGGSWLFTPATCRSAMRFWDSPDTRISNGGFRVVVLLSSGVD